MKFTLRGLVPALAIAAGGLAPACALTPPVQNSGALAKDGVQVAVVGQRCSETVEPEWPGANLVETVVEVQVQNNGPGALTVHRDQLRLRAPDGQEIPTGDWCATDPLAVESGQTKTFTVRFMTRGGLSCTAPMALDADAGLTIGAAPVRVGAVSFVPSKA